MNIHINRLNLPEISWDDLEIIHQLHSIPEVDEFNTLGIPENLDKTRNVIQADIDDQKQSARSRF